MIFLEYNLPLFTQNAGRMDYKTYRFNYPKNDENAIEKGKKMVDILLKHEWWIRPISYSYTVRALFKYGSEYINKDLKTYSDFYQYKKTVVSGK